MFAALLMIGVAAVAAAPVLLLGIAGFDDEPDDDGPDDRVPGDTSANDAGDGTEPEAEDGQGQVPATIQGLLDDVLAGQFDGYPEAPMGPVLQPVPGDVPDVPADDPIDVPVLQPVAGDVADSPGDPTISGPILSPIPGDAPEETLPAQSASSPIGPVAGGGSDPAAAAFPTEMPAPLPPGGEPTDTLAGTDDIEPGLAEGAIPPEPGLAEGPDVRAGPADPDDPNHDDPDAGQSPGGVL